MVTEAELILGYVLEFSLNGADQRPLIPGPRGGERDLAEALRLSRQHLENAGERVMRLILIGKRLGQRRAAGALRPGR